MNSPFPFPSSTQGSSSQPKLVDVAVVGRGPIGAAAALMAEQAGLSVAWLGREPATPVQSSSGWDARVYALSIAARAVLSELRVWDALERSRIAPVYDMRIYPAGANPVELHFGAYEGNTEALAWIVEGSNLNTGLRRAIDFSRVQLVAANLQAIELATSTAVADHLGNPVWLRLDDGSRLQTRLVIGADGADSLTRSLAGLAFSAHDYSQTAVVANFAISRPHADCALQWFGDHGVLALLPLPGQQCSMVWSAPHKLAAELMALDALTLSARVQHTSGGALGALQTLSSPASFVLRRIDVPQMVTNRIALVGDAAHVIHPLAGQGMNLGFADIQALGKVLRARESYRDPGDRLLLRRYERSRKEAVRAMTLATDGLHRIFDSQELARLGVLSKPMTLGRDIGWSLVARSSWLKRQLMGLAAT